MVATAPLSITFVVDPADPPPPWPLALLRQHLAAAGHEVALSTDGRGVAGDVVHAFGWRAARAVLEGSGQVPVVLTAALTGEDSDERADLARRADRVVVGSSHDQALANRMGVPNFRIATLPVGVDCDAFTRLGPMAGRTGRFRLVASVGRNEAGLLTAVDVLAMAEDTELVALGTESDGGLPPAVEDAARAAGVRDRIAAVATHESRERAWWLRSGHAALALDPCHAAPQFVAEAMACGTAVVATPVDAQSDLVVHGVTGFHVPRDASVSAARAVRQILGDEFSREAYGMAAADRATSRLAWPRVAADFAALYRSLVARADLDGATDALDDEVDPVDVPA